MDLISEMYDSVPPNQNSFLQYLLDFTRIDKNDVWIMNPFSYTAVGWPLHKRNSHVQV